MPTQLVPGLNAAGPYPQLQLTSTTEVQTTRAKPPSPANKWLFPRIPADSMGPDTFHTSWKNRHHRPVYSPHHQKNSPTALPEARLILGTPKEESGFIGGQAGSRDPRRL